MQCVVLGSGTSHGIPVIGCSCSVCTSAKAKNNRTRSSVWIQHKNQSIVIDTSTDFRTQALREGMNTLDAIFLTHAHADHIHGLDDIRPLSYEKKIPVFGSRETLREVRSRFDYVFRATQQGGGKPNIELCPIGVEGITFEEMSITPIPVKHGELDIFAYRVNDELVYCTDCSYIPESSFALMKGCKVFIVGALRHKPHATHFSVGQALEAARIVAAKRTYLTHICHRLEHNSLLRELPHGIEPSWDGLTIDLTLL